MNFLKIGAYFENKETLRRKIQNSKIEFSGRLFLFWLNFPFSQPIRAGTFIFFLCHSSPYLLIYHHAWAKIIFVHFCRTKFLYLRFFLFRLFETFSNPTGNIENPGKLLAFPLGDVHNTQYYTFCVRGEHFTHTMLQNPEKRGKIIKIIWVLCVP